MQNKETQLLIIEYLNAGLIPYVPFSSIHFDKKPTRKQKRKFRKLWRKIAATSFAAAHTTSAEYPSFKKRRLRKTIVLNEMFSRIERSK